MLKSNTWFMEHSHLKISWIHYQMNKQDGALSYSPPPYFQIDSRTTTSASTQSPPSSSSTRISPAVLFIIVILAVLFFISGLLHLLVRFLIKHPSSSGNNNSSQSYRYPQLSGSDALQRQLQQLFTLHDSGLDQAFIDALPVFQYKAIVGLKEPFDCAVCLCEFSEKDKLRLLPMCSHAFHINCIDTWLLSNSPCPLCRGTLFTPGVSIENPMFDFEELWDDEVCASGNGENGFTPSQKIVEIEEPVVEKSVVPVRLGKFRRLDNDGAVEAVGETSSSSLAARRCFSMGSYQYVLGESDLRITVANAGGGGRDIKRYEQIGNLAGDEDMEGKKITCVSKGESYSVSKIWLWSKKGKFSSSRETHMAIPSSLNSDLSWMDRTNQA